MTKTIWYVVILACLSGFCFIACKKDKPKTVPTVTTLPVTEGTTNSGKGGGKITNTGNNEITAKGLVYSSTVAVPTLADNKTVVTSAGNDFESVITGLNSGTTYHIRAYATNGVGTAYGEVVDFMTGNSAPVASNVTISGTSQVENTVTASYTYTDAENNPESGTTFKWYSATDANGGGEVEISGATASTFTITNEYEDKFIAVAVTPMASAGTTTGTTVKSAYVEVGQAPTSVTFTYNGAEVTYGIIISPTTGRKWLDRNLGAPTVASSVHDYANFGDMFQWGRLADGHQLILRLGATDADMSGVTGTTSLGLDVEYSNSDVPGHDKFIANKNGADPVDWRNPPNDNLWQGASGSNNPCPPGWKLPTEAEWVAEDISDLNDGFTKLKLTLTGVRSLNSQFYVSDTYAFYWSSTLGIETPTWARASMLDATTSTFVDAPRMNAYPVRCIKN